MLLSEAFDISDNKGVNDFLTKYRHAADAHILITDWRILVPYEDGAPPTESQGISKIREEHNKLCNEMEIIARSSLPRD